MVKFAILAQVEAKPGKEEVVAQFLAGASPLAAARTHELKTQSGYRNEKCI